MNTHRLAFATIITFILPSTASAMGTLRFDWAGGDCWEIYRGSEYVDFHCGDKKSSLQAGGYIIKPRSHPYFAPFSVNIVDGMTTTVTKGGFFQFDWSGGDCWEIHRGSEYVDFHCGDDKQALDPGRYLIKPRSHPYFASFRVEVQAGMVTTVTRGGLLELEMGGNDCWEIYRGSEYIDFHCGDDKQALDPGQYLIKPRSQPVFSPFRVTIREGQVTQVRI